MRTTRVTTAALAAGLSAGLLVAGCGGGGSGGGGDKTVTVTAPSGGGPAKLTVEAHDVYFTPKSVKAPAGKLAIDYVEKGSQQHTFVIDGVKGFELKVGPGAKSDSGTVDLAPGSYTFYCSIPGHRAQGMQGTITVAS
jgi:plastocyanin